MSSNQSQASYADRLLLCEAYEVARGSPDPSTQNGAVLATAAGFKVYGLNSFPLGVSRDPERLERPLKYQYVEHAERSALYNAARCGATTYGATMYCPWYACTDCARGIIAAGVRRIVGHLLPEHQEHPRWHDSIKLALEMLAEAGVYYEWVEGKLGCSPIKMDGKMVYP